MDTVAYDFVDAVAGLLDTLWLQLIHPDINQPLWSRAVKEQLDKREYFELSVSRNGELIRCLCTRVEPSSETLCAQWEYLEDVKLDQLLNVARRNLRFACIVDNLAHEDDNPNIHQFTQVEFSHFLSTVVRPHLAERNSNSMKLIAADILCRNLLLDAFHAKFYFSRIELDWCEEAAAFMEDQIDVNRFLTAITVQGRGTWSSSNVRSLQKFLMRERPKSTVRLLYLPDSDIQITVDFFKDFPTYWEANPHINFCLTMDKTNVAFTNSDFQALFAESCLVSEGNIVAFQPDRSARSRLLFARDCASSTAASLALIHCSCNEKSGLCWLKYCIPGMHSIVNF